jgi:hypothetical protein
MPNARKATAKAPKPLALVVRAMAIASARLLSADSAWSTTFQLALRSSRVEAIATRRFPYTIS